MFVAGLSVLVVARSVNNQSAGRLALLDRVATVTAIGRPGLQVQIRVVNTSDHAVVLDSIQAEFGCRAKVEAVELPARILPHQTKTLSLKIRAMESALCPLTSSRCTKKMLLHPILVSESDQRRVFASWSLEVTILRPFTVSHPVLSFQSHEGVRSIGGARRRLSVEFDDGALFTQTTLTGNPNGLELKSTPRVSDVTLEVLAKTALTSGNQVAALRIVGTAADGSESVISVPINVTDDQPFEAIPSSLVLDASGARTSIVNVFAPITEKILGVEVVSPQFINTETPTIADNQTSAVLSVAYKADAARTDREPREIELIILTANGRIPFSIPVVVHEDMNKQPSKN